MTKKAIETIKEHGGACEALLNVKVESYPFPPGSGLCILIEAVRELIKRQKCAS